MAETISVTSIVINGIRIELMELGEGRPLLFLHPAIGIEPDAPVLDRLAARARVIAPIHPGFGGSEAPKSFDTVDDLAYFYLDVLQELDLADVALVGVSLGGWIAAEIAIKSTQRMSHLVLANPVGIKVGDRETRDIADIFAMTETDFLNLAYHDPERRQARLQDHAGRAGAQCRAQPRSDCTLRLVALHARPEAQGPAASHPHPDTVSVGHGATAFSASATAAPIAPPFPARASSRSSAPAIFRISSSRTNLRDKIFAFIARK